MEEKTSVDSLLEADRYRVQRSRHGGFGAAGFISPLDQDQKADFLTQPGEVAIVNPPEGGLPDIKIGVAWDVVKMTAPKRPGFFQKLFHKKPQTVDTLHQVDLDIGALYELEGGEKGGIQAFGERFGAYETSPYIHLSGDERTGLSEGEDEVIRINGAHWPNIKRLLLYVYIYHGIDNWNEVRPQLQVYVPGQKPMIVSLRARESEMDLCAVALLENVRGGIRMTSCLEYYPGHAEMDRAFGFGLGWTDGHKRG
jgi:tellurite resistance protein TerA